MWWRIAIALILTVAGASPLRAQVSACTAPVTPAFIDPAGATGDQLRGLLAAAQAFIAASNAYQACLNDDLQAQKDQASKESKPLDPAIEAQVRTKLAANQRDKEKVGNEATNFVSEFKSTHTCEGKPLASCQN